MLKKILCFTVFFLICQMLEAERVRILNDAKESLRCRIDLIQQAKSEILVSYFIIDSDYSGGQFLRALRDAQLRGVKVSIIVDAMGDATEKGVWRAMQASGVEVRIFNKISFSFGNLWIHSHDKLMVIDSSLMITGGRNIKDAYFDYHKKYNFLDRDVLVQGDVCLKARNYFFSIWNSKQVEVVEQKKKYQMRGESIFQTAQMNMEKNPDLYPLGENWLARAREVQNIRFWFDTFKRKNKKNTDVTDSLIVLVNQAKQSIFLQNAYILPGKRLHKAFVAAAKRGVKITTLTSSIVTTDIPLISASYLFYRKKLRKMNADTWEYNDSAKKVHLKTMVIDSLFSIIGTYNYDIRSEKYDTETMLVIKDAEHAREHLAYMEGDFESAYKLDKKLQPIGYKECFPQANTYIIARARILQYAMGWWAPPLLEP